MAPLVQIFSNPRSGTYSPRRITALASAFEGLGARVVLSESSRGAPAIDPEATHVCIAGGDGTVRHVAAAIARGGHAVTLCIYPAGTVNLLAMEAETPADPQAFAAAVLGRAEPRRLHPVRLGEDYFFACASVGPDSAVVSRVTDKAKRRLGRWAYVVAFAQFFLRWERNPLDLVCDGRNLRCEALYVAKGRYYAGRTSFAHAARFDDPLLHVVALTTARRRDYLRFVWALARRRDPGRGPGVTAFTCSALEVSAARELPLQADGDIVGVVPARFVVDPAGLAFA